MTESLEAAAKALGLDEVEVVRPPMSTNERSERMMGRRGPGQPIDMPCEQGYRCPVCVVEEVGYEDEALQWSEYNGFLWCERCDRDYPSALCVPLVARRDDEKEWRHAIGPDAAVTVFLDTVEAATARHMLEHRPRAVSDAYAVPEDGGRYHYLCEKGHHITSSQRDIGPTCSALLSALPGGSRSPCGADIEWRQIPYSPRDTP